MKGRIIPFPIITINENLYNTMRWNKVVDLLEFFYNEKKMSYRLETLPC